MTHQERLTRFCTAFVSECVKSGVKDIVVSPGSRSTPLTVLFNKHPGTKMWMSIDERSAAFFALGMAKASRRPVALLCTSGTAAANYYPAIIEAELSRIPLIVLTSDRPHHLRNVGAPQAIDQIKLYGGHVKWFQEMPPQSDDELQIAFTRASARRAYLTASLAPAGPVHLNFPFEEPLVPDLELENLWENPKEESGPPAAAAESQRRLSPDGMKTAAGLMSSMKKGLIVVGPHTDPALSEAAVELAEKCGFPILADPLSSLRTGKHDKSWVIDSYDAFLRDPFVCRQMEADGIIRFGPMPVSKAFLKYLEAARPKHYLVIDEGDGWLEPTHLPATMLYCDPVSFCKDMLHLLVEKPDPFRGWGERWKAVNSVSGRCIRKFLQSEFWFEGQVMAEIIEDQPDHAALFVGNSMPVRDLDSFLLNQKKPLFTLANRGANGIDGVVSSALGAATAVRPLTLVIGDLSFYHDMNGLLAAKLHHLHATIVVINNNGGGIFSFLPQAEAVDDFDALFSTPIGLNIEKVSEVYEAEYRRPESWPAFHRAYQEALSDDRLHIIEVKTDRQANVIKHRSLWAEVAGVARKVLKNHDKND